MYICVIYKYIYGKGRNKYTMFMNNIVGHCDVSVTLLDVLMSDCVYSCWKRGRVC